MPAPARFPSGFVNRPAVHPMGNFMQFDPTRVFSFFDDFDRFTIAAAGVTGWISTVGGAATTAAGVATGNNGVVLFAPNAGAASFITNQWGTNATKHPILLPVAGKKFWLRSRFKTEDADQNNLYVGGAVASADPFGTEPTDQFVFRSLNATPEALMLAVGATATTEVTIALGNTADDTWSTCTAYYDGKDTVSAWRENDAGVVIAAGSVSVVNGTLLPDAALVPTFSMQNKDTGADDFSIDYLLMASER